MIKIKAHIPTGDFAFIEQEIEGENCQEVVSAYNELENAIKGRNGQNIGLPTKEFNAVLDEYLTTNSVKNGTEFYARMNKEQQQVLQEIKKSFKRLEAKTQKDEQNT